MKRNRYTKDDKAKVVLETVKKKSTLLFVPAGLDIDQPEVFRLISEKGLGQAPLPLSKPTSSMLTNLFNFRVSKRLTHTAMRGKVGYQHYGAINTMVDLRYARFSW